MRLFSILSMCILAIAGYIESGYYGFIYVYIISLTIYIVTILNRLHILHFSNIPLYKYYQFTNLSRALILCWLRLWLLGLMLLPELMSHRDFILSCGNMVHLIISPYDYYYISSMHNKVFILNDRYYDIIYYVILPQNIIR